MINKKGLDLVKKFEGLYLKAYLCPANVWTIGYGHTGSDVTHNLIITEEQANELLAKDMQKFEKDVCKLVKVELTENMFSALVSFSFNVGSQALKTSTLLKLLNDGKYMEAALEFARWNKANGKELPGLTRRRKAEKELFLTGISVLSYNKYS